MSKQQILGLDLGTNSIGWALLEAVEGKPHKIIGIGSRIFTKAVEEKTPTPKNVKRRDARLARRVLQRRARRKQRLRNYLITLSLLPPELKGNAQPETILNGLGDPYKLRKAALDRKLSKYELGRVLLHLVQRRGFLSNRKTLLGDLADDPDVRDILAELEAEGEIAAKNSEETAFKLEISELRTSIRNAGCRTLGEYLAGLDHHDCKRNRSREGGHLRTDRQMYREELGCIWDVQSNHHPELGDTEKEQIENIIFYQRPLKLRADRIGKCSLEPNRKRANIARLECQRFRYLQDINHLRYLDPYQDTECALSDEDRKKLIDLFEMRQAISFPQIRKALGLSKEYEFNLEQGNKKLKGNITSCEIRKVHPEWDEMGAAAQKAFVEDLLTIHKKSVLKKRLITHWDIDKKRAVDLCLLEFEPGHSNHSLKAISRLLPYLDNGDRYDEARVHAGYGYAIATEVKAERLGQPPEIANPIVQRALHELRRVVNAVISEYGCVDVVRIEMARDLEMNTKKYKAFEKQQKQNTKANEEAVEKYQEMAKANPHLGLSQYPSRSDKIRYRIWKDQEGRCAYGNKTINLSTLFSAEVDVDHIIPYSESLDDSYMNKVVCFAGENRYKGQRTPIDAFSGDTEKWGQITQAISRWPRNLKSKRDRFYKTASDVQQRDFINSQLNDTRYISRVAQSYLGQLGADITTCKGATTSWVRHQWGLNSLIGETSKKERDDHRHHAVDALVVACIDRRFYRTLVTIAKDLERRKSVINIRDLHFDPPWDDLREDLALKLSDVIISHASQKKLTGSLHEETGVGYIEGIGTVYRANLDSSFKAGQLSKIIDPVVQDLVRAHLHKYENDPKAAFSEGVFPYHKDGKTPIKRVRIAQSKTSLKALEKSKFGVRNQQNDVFKWLAYGNLHHVEVLNSKRNGKFSCQFVTMMEACHRARGVNQTKTAIIQTDHGEDLTFVMAVHINDIVRISKDGITRYYRVQKLEQPNGITLRLHTASSIGNDAEKIRKSISTLMSDYKMEMCAVNAIGKLQHVETDY